MWKDFLGKSNNKESKKRELWLDIAKAFGIFAVILNHMEINIPVVTFLCGMFYMPLFFVAAGYTYRRKEERFLKFAAGKAKRLLVPYAFCNLALFAFFTLKARGFDRWAFLGMFYSRSMLMAADTTWNIGLMPNLNAPTWFLTCMFLCYCFYFVIDRQFADAKKRRIAVAAAMLIGMILRTVSPVLLPWSIENALYCLGYFEVGRALKEGGLQWLRKNQWIYGNFFIAFAVFSLMNGTVNLSVSVYGKSMILAFVVGTLGSLLCMKAAELVEHRVKVFAKPLALIGQHTMPILCWHLLAIEILKKVLAILG